MLQTFRRYTTHGNKTTLANIRLNTDFIICTETCKKSFKDLDGIQVTGVNVLEITTADPHEEWIIYVDIADEYKLKNIEEMQWEALDIACGRRREGS